MIEMGCFTFYAINSKIVLNQIFITSNFCLLRRKILSLVLIQEIGKDVSGQDKTDLTDFQI